MKCSRCQEREGVITLTTIEEGEVRQTSLCARCAAEKGIETGAGLAETPLGGFLAALGEAADVDAAAVPAADGACPTCGATLKDFRETGRVGCATCYLTFEVPLRELLRRLHGSTHHTGMRYHSPEEVGTLPAPAETTVGELQEQLRRAVESEQFERAAELRDRLRGRE